MLREQVLPCEPVNTLYPSLVHEGSLRMLVMLQTAMSAVFVWGFLYSVWGFEICYLCG